MAAVCRVLAAAMLTRARAIALIKVAIPEAVPSNP